MSSPHLGGDFMRQLALKANRSGSADGSGRSTPIRPSSPAHRATPGQMAFGRPQPIRSSHSIGTGSGDDESDEELRGRVAHTGSWRPITPVRSGSSPRPLSGSFIPDSIASRIFPHSSRNRNINDTASEDMQMQMQAHVADAGGRDDDTMIATEDMVAEDAAHADYYEERTVRFSELHPVLKGYLLGQIACVIKFGVWWVGFTYLILTLFNGSSYLVGGTRICFNLALMLCSPMAGGFAERCNIKQLLNRTVVGRGIIYCMMIPLAWFLMDSGVLFAVTTPVHVSFFVVFLLVIFIDGIAVAFSNVADIDSGGVNLVAMQYGIDIDDNVRNYFNSLHILFFDLSMVIFNPLLAYLGLLVGQKTVIVEGSSIPITIVDELTLILCICGVFLLSTIVTLISYNCFMPDIQVASSSGGGTAGAGAGAADGGAVQTMHTFASDGGSGGGGSLDSESFDARGTMVASPSQQQQQPSAEPDPVSWAAFKELSQSVREGAVLTWQNRRIRWRVLFFAIETSVEDAMIALIAAEIGSEFLASAYHPAKLHYSYGQVWGSGLVAVGKCGGVIASLLMHRYFVVDEEREFRDPGAAYRPLFWFAFLGGAAALLLPLSFHLHSRDLLGQTAATSLLFLAMFLFFLLSTLSKIGFSTLMQSMAAEVEATGRVFGFVAAFVTATDALLLMAMSALFSTLHLQMALWISCAFIALHGLVQLLFGPALVLRPNPQPFDDQLRMDLAQPLM